MQHPVGADVSGLLVAPAGATMAYFDVSPEAVGRRISSMTNGELTDSALKALLEDPPLEEPCIVSESLHSVKVQYSIHWNAVLVSPDQVFYPYMQDLCWRSQGSTAMPSVGIPLASKTLLLKALTFRT